MTDGAIHPLRDFDLKLGRSRPSVAEEAKIRLRDFVDVERAIAFIQNKRAGAMPVITEKPLVDFSMLVQNWGMFLNDRLGDCTCASVAHGRMVFAALVDEHIEITDADVEKMYEAAGYVPGDESTDQGWTLVAAAEYAQNQGLLGTPDIDAFAEVSTTDDDEQQCALELFGGLSGGFNVPASALQQFQEGKEWTPTSGAEGEIVGGHAVWKVKSELRKSGIWVTWGSLEPASEEFEKEYFDEYVAFVPRDWESKLPAQIVEDGIVDFSQLRTLVAQYNH